MERELRKLLGETLPQMKLSKDAYNHHLTRANAMSKLVSEIRQQIDRRSKDKPLVDLP
jgi:hypothetical protein